MQSADSIAYSGLEMPSPGPYRGFVQTLNQRFTYRPCSWPGPHKVSLLRYPYLPSTSVDRMRMPSFYLEHRPIQSPCN